MCSYAILPYKIFDESAKIFLQESLTDTFSRTFNNTLTCSLLLSSLLQCFSIQTFTRLIILLYCFFSYTFLLFLYALSYNNKKNNNNNETCLTRVFVYNIHDSQSLSFIMFFIVFYIYYFFLIELFCFFFISLFFLFFRYIEWLQ